MNRTPFGLAVVGACAAQRRGMQAPGADTAASSCGAQRGVFERGSTHEATEILNGERRIGEHLDCHSAQRLLAVRHVEPNGRRCLEPTTWRRARDGALAIAESLAGKLGVALPGRTDGLLQLGDRVAHLSRLGVKPCRGIEVALRLMVLVQMRPCHSAAIVCLHALAVQRQRLGAQVLDAPVIVGHLEGAHGVIQIERDEQRARLSLPTFWSDERAPINAPLQVLDIPNRIVVYLPRSLVQSVPDESRRLRLEASDFVQPCLGRHREQTSRFAQLLGPPGE